jgi:hypothetical protein
MLLWKSHYKLLFLLQIEMTTKDIEVIPVERSSSEVPSHAHVDAKMKSNSSSNADNLKSQYVDINHLSKTCKGQRARNFSLVYDVSTVRKIRIAKYTVCFIFIL